jgi:hypothetical protein
LPSCCGVDGAAYTSDVTEIQATGCRRRLRGG